MVALEPSTGKILAMVSLPSYNPNLLASHDLDSVSSNYQRLDGEDSQPLVNRATQLTLPPGSTFKVVTAAAAIESGEYTADDQVPGGPTYQLPLTSGPSGQIGNEGRDCGTTRIPFRQAMGNSCNTSFAALANEVGAAGMLKQAEAFGFNSDYLRDLTPQAESVYPRKPNAAQVGQTGFGQYDVRATTLQMAMVAAGIANQGVVMRPYLVDQVQSPELDVLDQTQPEELSRAVSPSTADQLTDLMAYTVDSGTASPGAIPGIQVAGKTGTAQSGTDAPPYAWYIAFAPAKDPRVAVAVNIQRAGIARGEIAGGVYGGPIAKAVMEAVIRGAAGDPGRDRALRRRRAPLPAGGPDRDRRDGRGLAGHRHLAAAPGGGQAAARGVLRGADLPGPLRVRGTPRRLPAPPAHRGALRRRGGHRPDRGDPALPGHGAGGGRAALRAAALRAAAGPCGGRRPDGADRRRARGGAPGRHRAP